MLQGASADHAAAVSALNVANAAAMNAACSAAVVVCSGQNSSCQLMLELWAVPQPVERAPAASCPVRSLQAAGHSVPHLHCFASQLLAVLARSLIVVTAQRLQQEGCLPAHHGCCDTDGGWCRPGQVELLSISYNDVDTMAHVVQSVGSRTSSGTMLQRVH